MFALAAIPAILSLFLRRLLPESPRWLARQADLSTNGPPSAGAERAQPASERMLARMRARLALLGSHPLWLDFFGPGARRRTLCLWTVSFAAFFLAYGMIVWLPDWGRGFSAPTLLATIHLAGLAGALAAAVIIDRTGRRPLLAACFAGAAFSLGALWLQWPGPAEWLPLFSSLGCFFAGGTVTGALLYSAELYPTRIRALGAGVAAAWTRIAWLAGLFITGAAIPGEPALLLPILAAIAALAAALTALFAVETSGRALEDISP
jgi:putative MFS transporter